MRTIWCARTILSMAAVSLCLGQSFGFAADPSVENSGIPLTSWQQTGLAISLMVLMAWIMYLLMEYSHIREKTGYLGPLFKEWLKDSESVRRKKPFDEKWRRGEYHIGVILDSSWIEKKAERKFPVPEEELINAEVNTYGFSSARDVSRTKYVERISNRQSQDGTGMPALQEIYRPSQSFAYGDRKPGSNRDPDQSGTGGLGGSDLPGGRGDEDVLLRDIDPSKMEKNELAAVLTREREKRKAAEKRRNQLMELEALWEKFQRKLHNWEELVIDEANKRFDQDKMKAEKDAEDAADRALGQIDFAALHGRGPEFLLNFTALIVIIFAATVLGIIEVLGKEHLGTLLAAVAGYVLGREVTRPRDHASESSRVPGGSTDRSDQNTKNPITGSAPIQETANTASSADQPPTVNFGSPVETGGTYISSQSPISIEGTANDDTGITEVRWNNNALASGGTATLSSGTTTRRWQVPEIPLKLGLNEISATAKDSSGNLSESARIIVKYEPPAPSDKGPVPSPGKT